MVGLPRVIYRITSAFHKGGAILLVALWLLAGQRGMLSAQAPADIRAQWGAYSADGSVMVQVAVPRGQTVEAAALTVQGVTVPLSPEPVPLPVEQWFVLDASGGMINAQTTVKTALERFLRGATDPRVGFVIYDSQVRVWQPSSQLSEITAILSDYNATASAPGCLGDALNALRQIEPQAGYTMRVLLIAGPLSRQGLCAAEPGQETAVPVDTLVIADELDEAYLDLTERSGGQLRRANLLTVEARINEIKTAWAQPVYALRGTLSALPTGRGTVTMSLSGGQTYSLSVPLVEMALPPEQAASAPQLQRVATSTPPPATDAPPSTPAPVMTLPPRLHTLTPTPEPGLDTVMTAQPRDPASPTAPAENTVPTNAPSAGVAEATAPPDDPGAVAALPPNPEPENAVPPQNAAPGESAPPPAPESESTGESSDLFTLVGGGLVVLAAVILAGYTLGARRRKKHVEPPDSFYEPTFILPDDDETDFYATGGIKPSAPVLPGPPPLVPADPDDDELMITQMLSDGEFQAMRRASVGDVIGWLRLNTQPPRDYELYASGATIGRRASCDVPIPNDGAVSGEHVRLDVRADGAVWLTVVSRTNPAVVSGVVVPQGQSRALKPQDVIQLSTQTRLVFILRGQHEFDDEVTTL